MGWKRGRGFKVRLNDGDNGAEDNGKVVGARVGGRRVCVSGGGGSFCVEQGDRGFYEDQCSQQRSGTWSK